LVSKVLFFDNSVAVKKLPHELLRTIPKLKDKAQAVLWVEEEVFKHFS